MANAGSIYLEMYKEYRTHVRHHETQRSAVATVCLGFVGVTAAYVSNIAVPGFHHRMLLGPGLFLIVVGVLASLLGQKQYERTRFALAMASRLIVELDECVLKPEASGVHPATLQAIEYEVLQAHTRTFSWLYRRRLHRVWLFLFVLVAVIGFALVTYSLSADSRAPKSNGVILVSGEGAKT